MLEQSKPAPTANKEEFPGFFELQEPAVDRLTRHDNQTDMSLSVCDAAKMLGISERTVWRRIRQKKLLTLQDNGKTLVIVRQTDMSVTRPDTFTDVSVELSDPVTDDGVDNTTSQFFGLIADLSSKLEGATYRNGFLEAELEAAKQSLKLLPDLQTRASEAETLQAEVTRLRLELDMQKRPWWSLFWAWFSKS